MNREISINHASAALCGSCLARVYFPDSMSDQFRYVSSFTPGVKEVAMGLAICQQRAGKGGEAFSMFKFRTMPRADYPITIKVENNDGPKNPAVKTLPGWSRFLRSHGLDEIPQIINLLKGDLKIIGFRPMTMGEFHLLPPELKELKKRTKPGFIGIQYAHPPHSTFEERFKIESDYLKSYFASPILTDLKYLMKFLYQVFCCGRRSS